MGDLDGKKILRELVPGTIVPDEILWKYFRPERFISTLSDGNIYFASANKFDDPFEGAVAVQTSPVQTDPRYSEMETTEQAFFQLKRLTKVSCWHRAEFESDAMWKLYAGENKGVAICTTPDRIQKAIKPYRLKPEYEFEDLWAGPVDYVDLTQVRMRGASMLGRFFFKHRAFEWEREFRLAISLRTAEEFGVSVPTDGIFVEVDLNILIARIVLGSTVTDEERETISDSVSQAGLSDRLESSSLLGRPRYI